LAHAFLPPADDPSIPDGTALWRRIIPQWWIKDPATGLYRLSSEGFGDPPDGTHMSVAIRDEIVGGAARFLANCPPGCGIAEFTAGHARHGCHLAVARDPLPNEPWHAIVIGKKKKQNVRRQLRDGCQMVVRPREG
jgi:hypothetical protein